MVGSTLVAAPDVNMTAVGAIEYVIEVMESLAEEPIQEDAEFGTDHVMFTDGFGLHYYRIELPHAAIVDPLAGMLNQALQEQLSPENRRIFEFAREELKHNSTVSGIQEDRDDAAHAINQGYDELFESSFEGRGRILLLRTNIPPADLAKMIREARNNPDRIKDKHREQVFKEWFQTSQDRVRAETEDGELHDFLPDVGRRFTGTDTGWEKLQAPAGLDETEE